jgi:hypothetical protein
MPWQFYSRGKAADVAEDVKKLVQGQGEEDIAQFNRYRELVLAELATLKPDDTVDLQAQGTKQGNRLSVQYHLFTQGQL